MNCSLSCSSVHGIFQSRVLEWVAISFSNAWKWKVKMKSLSRVRLFETPWTAAYQAPLSMGFSSQEYWSGVPLPSLEGIRNVPKITFDLDPRGPWIGKKDGKETGGRRWKKKGQTFEQRDSRIGDVLRGENTTFLMLWCTQGWPQGLLSYKWPFYP